MEIREIVNELKTLKTYCNAVCNRMCDRIDKIEDRIYASCKHAYVIEIPSGPRENGDFLRSCSKCGLKK